MHYFYNNIIYVCQHKRYDYLISLSFLKHLSIFNKCSRVYTKNILCEFLCICLKYTKLRFYQHEYHILFILIVSKKL